MSSSDLVSSAQPRMQAALDHLVEEFRSLRSGRASTALVEELKVTYFDQQVPVKQLASLSTPDASTIQISAWDQASTAAIEKAIRDDPNLDFNPVSDGKTIHINVPAPTAERREALAKQVGEKVEQCYISLRSVRHEILNQAKEQLKNKQISEDEFHWTEKQLDSKIEEFRAQIEELAEAKRKEIREV